MEEQNTRDLELELVEFYWAYLPMPARIKLVAIAWLLAVGEMSKSMYVIVGIVLILLAVVLLVDNPVVDVFASISMGVILGATVVYWLLRDLIHRG